VIITLIIGGLGFNSIKSISSLTEELIEHPFQVTDRAQRLKTNIVKMDRDMVELVYSSNAKDIAKLLSDIRAEFYKANDNLDIVGQFYLGPKDDVNELKKSLARLESLYGKAISLKQAGRQGDALTLVRPGGNNPYVKADREVQKILEFAHKKATSLHNLSNEKRDQALSRLMIFIVVLLVIGILSARIIMRNVNQTQAAMRQLTERLSLSISAGGVGIWDYDVVNNKLTWDDQMFNLYGVRREQFGGAYEAWQAGLFPDDAERSDLDLKMALRGEKDFNTEFRVLTPDGTIRHVRGIGKVQRDEQGKPLRMVGTNWDVTEQERNRSELLKAKQNAEETLQLQRMLQNELVQAEKLAALGGLVAGVAHEVNTPVGITLSAATHLSSETKKIGALYQAGELTEEELTEYFATAQQASQIMTINSRRAADLIHSFKQITADQAGGEMRNFDLAEYLHEILLSVGPKLRKHNVAVRTDCPAGILLRGLPGALVQVLTNLIMNSLVHGYNEDQPGQIDISARDTGGNIELIYHDDGKGIPLEFHHKIFDPFFTTARGKGGTGLGLHIVYNIVTQILQGGIKMKSEPGQGTTFILRFPCTLAE
jgi:PAS domain S-box-containing protein